MSGDPGDIPRATRTDLVQALSVARDLPVEALLQLERRGNVFSIRSAVWDVIDSAASGETLSEREQNLLFWGLHALAAARDTAMLPLLLRLLRRPDEELETLLGDSITETVPRMVVSLYDGDWAGLRSAIVARETNDIARWQLILAAARCAAAGHIALSDVRALLVELDEERLIGSSDHGWYGWESAIALLGLHDLAPRVDAARRDGRLLEGISNANEFAEGLAAAHDHPTDLERFNLIGVRPFGSALDELEALLRLGGEGDRPEPEEPVRNPLRDLGRNDPCPCGSGKKFKKCCLAA